MAGFTDNARVALTIFEAWNEDDYDRARGVIADDFEAVEVGSGQTFAGADGLKREFDLWRTAFADGTIDVTNVIASGEHVAVESIVRGTHDGPFTTGDVIIAPTGRYIEFQMCTVAHIRNGKSRLERHYFDMAALISRLTA